MDIKIRLNTVGKKEDFLRLVNQFEFDIDLYKDTPNKSVDAKSALSVYAMGNSVLHVKCIDNELLRNELKHFE